MEQSREEKYEEKRELEEQLANMELGDERAPDIIRRLIAILLELEELILQDMANEDPYIDNYHYDRAKG